MQLGNIILTNAHCEILNTFINIGLLGVISYSILFLEILRKCIKKAKEQPILWIMIFGIVGYMCIGVISFSQVMSTPFVFIMMGLGERICEEVS